MVWGCFSWYEKGLFIVIHGTLNTDSYSNILDKNYLPSLRQFYGFSHCYFQDNNATCHVSRSTMHRYDDNGMKLLDWPAQIQI